MGLGAEKALRLGCVHTVLELGFDFAFVDFMPAETALGVGAEELVLGAEHGLALHPGGDLPLYTYLKGYFFILSKKSKFFPVKEELDVF